MVHKDTQVQASGHCANELDIQKLATTAMKLDPDKVMLPDEPARIRPEEWLPSSMIKQYLDL